MACKVTRTTNPALYSGLKGMYSDYKAKKLFDALNTDYFKNWYGKDIKEITFERSKDKKALLFINDKGQVKTSEELFSKDFKALSLQTEQIQEQNSDINLTNKEIKYGVNVATTVANGILSRLTSLTSKDVLEGNSVRNIIHSQLKAVSQKMLDAGKINKENHEVNLKIANEILNNEILWDKLKLSISNNLGYIINEFIEEDTDSIDKKWDDKSQLTSVPENKVSKHIKKTLSAISESGNSELGGLNTMLDSTVELPYLIHNLHRSRNVEDMLAKIKFLGDNVKPAYITFYNVLKNDKVLANLLFRGVKLQDSPRTALKEKGGEVSIVDSSLKAHAPQQLANNWINNAASLVNSKFVLLNSKKIKELYANIDNSKLDDKLDIFSEILEYFGISLEPSSIKKYLSSINLDSNASISRPKGMTDVDYLFIARLKPVLNILMSYVNDPYRVEKGVKEFREFDDRRLLNQMARELSHLFYPDTQSFTSVDGTTQSAFTKPSHLTDVFERLTDKMLRTEELSRLYNIPSMRYSNWLVANPDTLYDKDGNRLTNNLISIIDGKLIVNNIPFKVHYFDGVDSNGVTKTYTQLKEEELKRVKLEMFKNKGLIFIPSPADRGVTQMIEAPLINKRVKRPDGKISIDNLIKGVSNVFYQELHRIIEANKIFNAENNTDLIVDESKLYEDYHYKYIDGVRTFFDANGKKVGNAFKFYHFNKDILNINEILADINIDASILNEKGDIANKELKSKIDSFISEYTLKMIKDDIASFKNHKELFKTHSKYAEEVAFFTVNNFIANVEYSNFVQGDIAFYGNEVKMNKRGSGPTATGELNGAYNTFDSYSHVTIADRLVIPTKEKNRIRKSLTKLGVNKKVAKFIIDRYSKPVNTGDAQSYITLDEFIKRADLFGISKEHQANIDKLKQGIVNNETLGSLINLQKNFYFDLAYDSELNMQVPRMIKNSEFVLIPDLIKGTQLESLYNSMIATGIDQISFESASKVGSKRIARIADSKGNLIGLRNLNKELTSSIESLKYGKLIKQQEIVDHIIDTKNKLGARVIRKIMDNVTDKFIIKTVDRLIAAKYIKNYEKVKDKILNEDGTLNLESLSNILYDDRISNGNTNDISAVKIDERSGTFRLPLDFPSHRNKNISKFLSIFNSGVNKLTMPGVHGPQLSNAFMGKADKKTIKSDKDVEFNPTLKELDYSYFKNRDTDFISAEVLLPYWAKKLITGDNVITIEQLEQAGLNEMIGYRHPTEDKHSYFVFKVVGFLPESQGSTIVVPSALVTQMGSDFDIDSVYTMHSSFKLDKQGNPVKIEYIESDYTSSIEDAYYKLGITYTTEDGTLCAAKGLTNTTKGNNWRIVKDFKGKPKHSQGGVDISISDKGVSMRRGSKDIKAAHGLLIINNQ